MPCIIKGRIISVAVPTYSNRVENSSDCTIEVSFTDVFRQRLQQKSLEGSSRWNQSFRIEVSDESKLQDYPLKIELIELDGLTFGTLYIDLCILLYNEDTKLEGWLPLYDSLSGLSGEVYCVVDVDFIKEMNPYSEGSGSIPLFCSSTPATGTRFSSIFGFVEELLVSNDPEYHWRDLIRSSRFSNETRRNLLQELSMQNRRSIAKKALQMGANAVFGYQECVDLEGDVSHRICVRAVGTAVKLSRLLEPNMDTKLPFSPFLAPDSSLKFKHSEIGFDFDTALRVSDAYSKGRGILSPSKTLAAVETIGEDLMGTVEGADTVVTSSFKKIEILTLDRLPPYIDFQIGGIVAARSVKILNLRLTQDQRHSYWQELRDELRSHAMALNCDSIIGYSESICFNDEVILISCSGTAILLNYAAASPIDEKAVARVLPNGTPRMNSIKGTGSINLTHKSVKSCACMHIPNAAESLISPSELSLCRLCEREHVPSILLSSAECPKGLLIRGHAQGIEATVCRYLKKNSAEVYAAQVSEVLPFIELDLHRQLLFKLRLIGYNAAFGVKFEYSMSDTLMIGTAAATGVYVMALPPPDLFAINIPSISKGDRRYEELYLKCKQVEERNANNNTLLQSQPLSFTSALDGLLADTPMVAPPSVLHSFQKHGMELAEEIFEISDAIAGTEALNIYPKQTPIETSPMTRTVPFSSNLQDALGGATVTNRSRPEIKGYSALGNVPSTQIQQGTGSKSIFSFDVTDEADEDLVQLLYEELSFSSSVRIASVNYLPGLEFASSFGTKAINDEQLDKNRRESSDLHKDSNFVCAIRVTELSDATFRSPFSIAKYITKVKRDIYASTFFSFGLHGISNGYIASVQWKLSVEKDNILQLVLLGHFLPYGGTPPLTEAGGSEKATKFFFPNDNLLRLAPSQNRNSISVSSDSLKDIFLLLQSKIFREYSKLLVTPLLFSNRSILIPELKNSDYMKASLDAAEEKNCTEVLGDNSHAVELSPAKGIFSDRRIKHSTLVTTLTSLPHCTIKRQLGLTSLHIIKETTTYKTIEIFYQELVSHSLSIIRAHVVALGGNAFMGCKISNIYVEEDKNKMYAVLSVTGDVAFIT